MGTCINRRSFLAGATVGGVALASSGTAAALAEQEDAPKSEEYEISETLTYDMVIVGGGGGGVGTAAQAADNGLKAVVLEKTALIGGTCARAHGIFAVESSIQKEAGVEVTCEQLFTKCEDYHHWLADTDVTMTLFRKSAEAIDWMVEKGITFLGVTRSGDSEQTWHNPADSLGDALAILQQRAEEGGVEFRTECPAVKLLMEDGKVKGVVACDEASGAYIEFDAPVVLLATGGFICNREMVEQYTPFKFDNFFNLGTEGRNGDGINMGIEAGGSSARNGSAHACRWHYREL